MPVLKVELFSGRTPEQKAEFAEKVTQLTAQVLQCATDTVDVIFVDVDPVNWAHGGKMYAHKVE
jgi:4-oxalocrotonate tautomerase